MGVTMKEKSTQVEIARLTVKIEVEAQRCPTIDVRNGATR